ncbi:MAG: response regulator [Bacteroidales bacterium]|nr:response regulator [Bacteroidales bacterium]HOY37764.1 response regulator [Bacteroidales bacterium]HQP02973.1 response regulator [Bacteroidales bacterium]
MKTTKKVLIVDDDIDVITVLETILKKEGYTVISANDKVEGKKLALAERPDLAILDVMMTTHYEGFELAKDLIEDPKLAGMKVLMQSSIDLITTTNSSVQAMAREYRKDPSYRELQVLLIKDILSNNAGVDYRAENGESIWLPVDGFLRKPVDAARLLPEINRVLS